MHLILKLDLNILNFISSSIGHKEHNLDWTDWTVQHFPLVFALIEDMRIGVIYLRRAEYIVKQVNLKVGEQSVRITRNVMNNNMMLIANSYAKGPSASSTTVGFTFESLGLSF